MRSPGGKGSRMVRTLRRRYIAFRINSPRPLSRSEVTIVLGRALDERKVNFVLTIFDAESGNGVLRCDHRNSEEAKRCLNALTAGSYHLVTTSTSGTLEALKKRVTLVSRRRGRRRHC
jgi:RNase P/RNase MRP subunit POP5